jgi:hypothetical protein
VRVTFDETEVEASLRDARLHRLAVGNDQLRNDPGVAGFEFAEDLRQQKLRDRRAGANQKRPAVLPAHLLHARVELGGHSKNPFRVIERDDAGRRERDAAVGAIEEPDAEMLLELADLERDGRLRHAQRVGRLGERPMLGNRMERLQTTIRHA